MQKTVFCANCQQDLPHSAAVERGDIVLTCETCDRSVKFPATMTAEELQAAVVAHKVANEGLAFLRTDEDVIAAGLMSDQQIASALAAIQALQ